MPAFCGQDAFPTAMLKVFSGADKKLLDDAIRRYLTANRTH
ncbi:hypothetical protein HMPREF5505_0351 [Lactobacillus delbrueckii subsp. lactis DSM 20072]|nr:hypothetical protein HMPREF5505_0351 [Lactobacillus delbrueckii subsp. lactis DSM 20072]